MKKIDCTLGNYTGSEYEMKLLEGAKPYHGKPFPIHKIHEETWNIGLNRLINIGVLNRKKILSGKLQHL